MHVARILCPLDFSDGSRLALEQATPLARRYGARLTLLHVRPTVTPHPDMPVDGPVAPWLVAELDALRQRVAVAGQEATAAGVAVDLLATAGEPVHDILECAGTLPADLIVLGTHGKGGFQHLVLGSVTEKVLRKAQCPVLTVPPRVDAATTQLKRILCAVDFSDCSQKAVSFAATLAKESGAALTLIHVLDWPWHESATPEMVGVPEALAQAFAEYRRYLESSATERLGALAASVVPAVATATIVRFGTPYIELLDAAHHCHADLIVLGVRGRGALDLGFFGSTANHVVRSARCPVLTIRG
jgi:nucleotide-binding universal stress UspA family protein